MKAEVDELGLWLAGQLTQSPTLRKTNQKMRNKASRHRYVPISNIFDLRFNLEHPTALSNPVKTENESQAGVEANRFRGFPKVRQDQIPTSHKLFQVA